MTNSEVRVLEMTRARGLLRARELDSAGINRSVLSRMLDKGLLERSARGLYMTPEADVTEHQSLAEAVRLVPHSVVCLLSALRFHDLSTAAPHEVWLALPRGARRPSLRSPPIRVVSISRPAFDHGVDVHPIGSVSVPVTSPERTVADCFKFRSTVGLDTAIEALRDYLATPLPSLSALSAAAKACRVANVMRPYLDALL